MRTYGFPSSDNLPSSTGIDISQGSTVTSTNRIDATPTSQNLQAQDRFTTESRPRKPSFDWRKRYARNLWISDLLVLIWVVYGTQIAWLGFREVRLATGGLEGLPTISYWLFSAALIVVWMWSLGLIDSRSYRVIGTGTTEYVRVTRASFSVFGAVAIVAFLTRIDVARGYLLISLPVGVIMLVFVRWMWRQWLVSVRRAGAYSAEVLLVGSEASIANIAGDLRRSTDAGYKVVGACTPTGRVADTIPGTDIPVMGSVDAIGRALAVTGADTVVVTSSGDLPPGGVKRLSWSLEAGRQHLVLAPNITDIAGPRIHTRPVSGLPLIHVETPRFSSGQRFTKRLTDVLGSLALIVLSSPILAAVAIAVKTTSPGPLLFRQERIGLDGQPFHMLKFRSMRVGADKELKSLLEAQGTSEKPLFKIKDDPRITPVGKFIRKYSLDELPQFFNVLGGSMSLVGPRPQIAAEVALYSKAARRRLLARPGITGLWQVSGRSEVEWDQAVRLDLYYVENWSLMGDLAILFKTLKAVAAPGQTAV
ncbi:sugar transferase [Microbacterium aerolatum]|uniref:sugar transferase n=1 Tax=Microbacterium aerolatum TaxID=153731 RepID=UPI002001B2B8|nr:sugar transferase [Microbacterium aerolatum]MCK3769763.1 sugar transferase [Microbacterium aerolatum]